MAVVLVACGKNGECTGECELLQAVRSCLSIQRAYCAHLYDCYERADIAEHGYPETGAEACGTALGEAFCDIGVLRNRLANGAAYHADKFDACMAMYDADRSCMPLLAYDNYFRDADVCDEVIDGTVAKGDACYFDADCKGAYGVCGGGGVCEVGGALAYVTECTTSTRDEVCASKSCFMPGGGVVEDVSGICRQSCDADNDCGPYARCMTVGSSNMCLALCTSDGDCNGLNCDLFTGLDVGICFWTADS